MENHKNAIGELNSFSSEVLKFHSINDLQLPFYNKNKVQFKNEDNKLCVVYCVWANKGYVKFLYLSLLSQLQNTDILDFDIRIFVSEDLYEFVVNLLSPILDRSKIVKTPNGMAFKYGISVHPELDKYQVINFTDTDAFVFTKTKDVYRKIYNFHKKNPDSILMCNVREDAINTFKNRFNALTAFSNLSYEEYYNYFINWFPNSKDKIDDYLETKQWFLSCHFSYNRKVFDNFKFSSYVCNTLYKQFGCDETVWIMYAISNNKEILGISDRTSYDWVGATEYEEFIIEGNFNRNVFLHPITGGFCDNESLPLIYENILNYYESNI